MDDQRVFIELTSKARAPSKSAAPSDCGLALCFAKTSETLSSCISQKYSQGDGARAHQKMQAVGNIG